MAFWCRPFTRVLMLVLGIFSLVSFSIECLCIAPLILAVMIMRGLVVHPLFCIALINGSYLVCFCVMAYYGNLSWQYVNSMSWTIAVGKGAIGLQSSFNGCCEFFQPSGWIYKCILCLKTFVRFLRPKFGSMNSWLVYTMDHEVGLWKMVFFRSATSWSNIHGLIS